MPSDLEEPDKMDGSEPSAEPDHSQDLGQPVDTEESGHADGSGQPEESDEPNQAEEPGQTEEPGQAGEPGQAEEPGQTQEPDQSGESDEPDPSSEPDNTHKPEQPQEPDETEEPEQPEKPDKPAAVKLKKPVLKAASKPNGTIKLSWKKVAGAAEYVLLCSTKKDSGFHQIYSSKKAGGVYQDKGRVPGKVYYYQLAVFAKGRASRANSKIVAGRSLEKVTLTELSNLSGSRTLRLSWNPVKGADGYEILRKNAATGKYQSIGAVQAAKTSYTDGGREGGTFYSYKVYAKDASGGRSGYSQPMSQMAIDKDKKMIALTYDDGPSAYTPVVLDALAKYGGHATFFVVGSSVDRYADSIRRAVSLGCEIGNHTYDHSNLKNLSGTQVQSVLSRTNQAVKNQSGADIRLLRPPYGSYSSATFGAAGMPVIMWSIDTLERKTRSTSATIQCVQQKAYDGAIVLMHDLHQPTVMAADAIMKYLKSAGYQLVTVSEMAAYRGGLKKDAAYSQFRG